MSLMSMSIDDLNIGDLIKTYLGVCLVLDIKRSSSERGRFVWYEVTLLRQNLSLRILMISKPYVLQATKIGRLKSLNSPEAKYSTIGRIIVANLFLSNMYGFKR